MSIRKDSHNAWHEDTVEWDGVAIPYRYCHSRRRTLGMTVRQDRSVSVRVPLRTSLAAIREFVAGRGAWIAKVRERLGSDSPEVGQRYEDGADFLFQGGRYCLTLEDGAAASVHIREDSLVVTTPEAPGPELLAKLVESWYRASAVAIFRERLMACHRLMLFDGAAMPPLVIRPMKSRWGSYSYRTGRVNLNLHLIKLPQACLDYVIIHELCHITVRHHGPGFWRLVGRHCPDYAARRLQLRAFSSSLL